VSDTVAWALWLLIVAGCIIAVYSIVNRKP